MGKIEKRLEALGLELPEVQDPRGSYVIVSKTGNLIYTSGTSCFKDNKFAYLGKLGQDLTVAEGYDASRLTALNVLSILKRELGSLDKIKGFVKVMGYVNSTDSFIRQPEVIDGASDLLLEVLEEKGKHARTAIGNNTLPFNIPVEIDVVVEVEE